jgi:hypothetical protein
VGQLSGRILEGLPDHPGIGYPGHVSLPDQDE